MDIEQRVKKIVAKQLKVNENDIKQESEFVRDLGADSIQSIELIALFEEEFDIEIDEQAALSAKTIGSAIAFIKKVIEDSGGKTR